MTENGNDTDEKMALFKYSLIVPALNGTFVQKSLNEYFFKVAEKEYELPNGKKKVFHPTSIKKWYYLYKKYGFNGLKSGTRSDRGKSKNIPLSIFDTIREIKSNKKHITKRGIYHELCELGEIRKVDVAESTFYRFLKLNSDKLTDEEFKNECKAFEAARCNDIWQADTSNVMRINHDGKSSIVYLIHIIDDASRLVVGHTLTFNDNAINFQDTLKKAIKVYGIPKVLYVDNGSPYANAQLELICANLGIQLVHAKPYSPRR